MGLKRLREWANDWAEFLGLAAFGSAVFLLFAMLMPNWFARTSWTSGGRTPSSVIDSPASYVGFLSLCGFIALVALAIGAWRRWSVAAAMAAATFACAAYVAGSSWWSISRGAALLDGKPVQDMGPPEWTMHWPTALPLFLLAAIVGAIGAVALAVSWHDRA